MIFLYYRIFKEIRKRAKRSHAKSSTTPSSGHHPTHQKTDTKTQSKLNQTTEQLTKPDAHKITCDKLAKPTMETTSSQQESNSDEIQAKNKRQQTKSNRVRSFIPLVGNRKAPVEKVTVNVTRSEIDEEDEEEDSELTGSDQQQGGKPTSEVVVTPSAKQTKKDAKPFNLKKIIQSDKNNNQLDKQPRKGISTIIKSTKGANRSKQSGNEDALIIANVSALNHQDDDVQATSKVHSKARRIMGRFALSAKLKTEDEPTTLDLDYLNTTCLPATGAQTKTVDSKLSKETLKEKSDAENESGSELMMNETEPKVMTSYSGKDNSSKLKIPPAKSILKPAQITRSITMPLQATGICVDCGQLCTHSKTLENFHLTDTEQLSCIVDIVADFCHENNEVEILMENTNQTEKLLPDSNDNELAGEETVEILANRGARLTDPTIESKSTCVCDHQLTNGLVNDKLLNDKESDRRTTEHIVDSKDKVEIGKQQQASITTTVTSIITTSTITGSSSSNSVKPVSTINTTTNGYLVKSVQDDEQPSSNETATVTRQEKSTTAIRSTDQLSKKKSRFNLGRKQKNSRKKREKASAKRERKATKTLAIVLGKFFDQ